MSDLLGIGLSGLSAYRSALAAVGENVANAETPGYARRTITLREGVAGASRIDPAFRAGISFGGVTAASVERAWDAFQATEARLASSEAARTGAREQWLGSIETALDDGSAGIGSSLTDFFTSADRLAATPNDALGRSAMLMALDDVAGSFRTTASALGRISTAIGDAAGLDVTAVNDTLGALAQVNSAIRAAAPGGSARAALEDQRDLLIDRVAERLDVQVATADNGQATLALSGDPSVTLLGPGNHATLALAADADGRLSLTATTSTGTTALTAPGGRLAGLIDAADTVADRLASLDAIAQDFAAALNTWSAAGQDADGNPGAPLLSASGGAASLTLLTTDPDRIPAATAGGAVNGNLLALSALRGEGGAERRWTGLVATNAQALASARSAHGAVAAWRDNAFAALDETTGIDLDREAADLLRYQQAYAASARIIQVARETIDTLLNSF